MLRRQFFSISLLATFFCIFFPLTVTAQSSEFSAAPGYSTSLSVGMVARVYESYKDLLAEFKEYEPEGHGEGIADYLQAEHLQTKVNSVVNRHGYENLMAWYGDFVRVMQVYAVLKMEFAQQQMPAIEDQLRQIQANPNMTDEQKQYAINMMQSSQTTMRGMLQVGDADRKALQPYLSRFDALLDKQE